MEDFNAQVGGDYREEKAMGKHSFSCQNHNGEKPDRTVPGIKNHNWQNTTPTQSKMEFLR